MGVGVGGSGVDVGGTGVDVGGNVGSTVGDAATVGLGVGVAVALAPQAVIAMTNNPKTINERTFRMFIQTSKFDLARRCVIMLKWDN